jgi:hypothetical protein
MFCGLAKYRLAQMLNYSTKACGGILPNRCYVLGGLSALNLI